MSVDCSHCWLSKFHSALANPRNMLHANPNAIELEPWLVILETDAGESLALWQVQKSTQNSPDGSDAELSVAIFSDETKARNYAMSCCSGPARVFQVDQTRFLSLMVDCFRQGIRYATLNPGGQTAHSLFVLRDVLKAAKEQLTRR